MYHLAKMYCDYNDRLISQKSYHNATLVFGDLHGSWEKLIHHLVVSGMLLIDCFGYYFDIQRNPKFLEYYMRRNLAYLNPKSTNRLILLGDIFADRNPDDEYKLELLYQMSLAGCNFTILMSNHDLAFYEYLTNGFTGVSPAYLIEIKDDERKDINLYFWTLLKNNYKLFEYIESGDDKIFLSHAPVTIDTLVNKFAEHEFTSAKDIVDIGNKFFKENYESYARLNNIFDLVWERTNDWWEPLTVNFKDINLQVFGHDTMADDVGYICLDNMFYKTPQLKYGEENYLVIY